MAFPAWELSLGLASAVQTLIQHADQPVSCLLPLLNAVSPTAELLLLEL